MENKTAPANCFVIKVTCRPPADIRTSWDRTYDVTPMSGQSQEDATEQWYFIRRQCGEFADTLLAEGESDTYKNYRSLKTNQFYT